MDQRGARRSPPSSPYPPGSRAPARRRGRRRPAGSHRGVVTLSRRSRARAHARARALRSRDWRSDPAAAIPGTRSARSALKGRTALHSRVPVSRRFVLVPWCIAQIIDAGKVGCRCEIGIGQCVAGQPFALVDQVTQIAQMVTHIRARCTDRRHVGRSATGAGRHEALVDLLMHEIAPSPRRRIFRKTSPSAGALPPVRRDRLASGRSIPGSRVSSRYSAMVPAPGTISPSAATKTGVLPAGSSARKLSRRSQGRSSTKSECNPQLGTDETDETGMGGRADNDGGWPWRLTRARNWATLRLCKSERFR